MAVEAQFYSENLGLQSQTMYWNSNPATDSGLDGNGMICSNQGGLMNPFSYFSNGFLQSLNAELEFQRQEIDYILQSQNETLSFALREHMKHQFSSILTSFEASTSGLMRQKEEDLAQARKKTVQLEEWLKKAEVKINTWQELARAKEATVMELNKKIEEVRERVAMIKNNSNRGAAEEEDAESCSGSCDDDHRSDGAHDIHDHNKGKKLACKNCENERSCVLFLPCRHICSCKSCEASLASCPVCKSVKEASFEIFFGLEQN